MLALDCNFLTLPSKRADRALITLWILHFLREHTLCHVFFEWNFSTAAIPLVAICAGAESV
jgi:hypothetical protein